MMKLPEQKQSGRDRFDVLHKLIKRGDIVGLRRSLDRGADPNLSNRLGWTLLMLAALEGNSMLGELLISRGADVNATNKFGQTALSLAAHRAHKPFIKLLLSNGASADCLPHGSSLENRLRSASGLPSETIESIVTLIRVAKPE
jgi:ankyrin repeat protein